MSQWELQCIHLNITLYLTLCCVLKHIAAFANNTNGGWSSWKPMVSACSTSCGHGTKVVFSRECNNPSPTNEGAQCVGSTTQSVPCINQHCPGEVEFNLLVFSISEYWNFGTLLITIIIVLVLSIKLIMIKTFIHDCHLLSLFSDGKKVSHLLQRQEEDKSHWTCDFSEK